LFEVANGGTIFLDEIGDTTPTIQVKLLRVIQEREFRRVGGNQDLKVDVRIIAATNRDLEKAVADGSFREDLYYRLDVIPIRLPPLRLRTGDIPMLVNHFLEKFSKESGKPAPVLDQEAMHVLLGHEWRGNVRELENLIERVVAFSTGGPVTETEIRGWLHHAVAPQQSQGVPTDLPEDGLDLEGLIDGIEKDLLLKALERARWVKKKAARLLKLNTRSFRYRLEKYAIKGGRD
jgi:two-component system response regulator PilR (NtrC family)